MPNSADTTPETRVAAELALRVYQKVIARADDAENPPSFGGVTALTDPDGYAVTLTDGTVSARVLFHNRVAIQTPSSRALARFRKRLTGIDSGDTS